MLNDARDEPCLLLLLNVASPQPPRASLASAPLGGAATPPLQVCLVVPAAAALFAAPPSHALGFLYLAATYALFLQRFMLTLHFTEHRRLFRPGLGALNNVIPLLLCPLFGLPSGLYWLHHCVVHHSEGNGAPGDISSTERYQRDSPGHFLLYWLRFLLATTTELPVYALRKRRYGLAAKAVLLTCAHAREPRPPGRGPAAPARGSSRTLVAGWRTGPRCTVRRE